MLARKYLPAVWKKIILAWIFGSTTVKFFQPTFCQLTAEDPSNQAVSEEPAYLILLALKIPFH